MISLISMAYNQQHFTEMLLTSLADPECADVPFELVFIDNGSSDSTPDLVQNFPLKRNANFLGLHYHAFPENRGVAQAVNQGVKLAKGDVILQADNDIIFGPSSFSILKSWISRHPGAMISPNWPWIQKKLGRTFFTSSQDITSKKMHYLKNSGMRAPLEKYRATGSCWMCSKKLFQKVNGWDVEYKNICASDDFLWKIALTGAARFTVPCPVYHPGKITRGSLPKNSAQQEKDLKRFNQYWGGHPEDRELLRKHQSQAGLVPDPLPRKSFWRSLFSSGI
ncbi:glycosyltransferase [bacterium]|nr:glycosyltransferase [bacterium]